MSTPFIGEIKMFAGNFAPRDWSLCDGQLLPISQNSALFALIGTTYGGDGQVTFALPDCRGRVPIHMGTGAGLSPRQIGEKAGSETVTLTPSQIPAHSHGLVATTGSANAVTAAGNNLASSVGGSSYHSGSGRGSIPAPMNAGTLKITGGSQPHNNLAPSLCVNFIIALFGIYPSRS
jgi:microcystin-dependent protein